MGVVTSTNGAVFGYEGRPVVGPISASIAAGEFVVVKGPNGCGKSTLLKGLMGLIKPMYGRVTPLNSRDLGYVPQATRINRQYPALVRELVLMGCQAKMRPFQRPGRVEGEAVADVLDRLGLTHLSETPVSHLSGGQLQQVLLARAIVSAPSVLTLDEPTAAIDERTEHLLASHLGSLNAGEATTVILITHNSDAFLQHATVVWDMGDDSNRLSEGSEEAV